MITIEEKALENLYKDRLDFGFDSIYFRYAILCDEVARLKAERSHDYEKEHCQAETRKMHFYNCLEQLVHAHVDNKNEK